MTPRSQKIITRIEGGNFFPSEGSVQQQNKLTEQRDDPNNKWKLGTGNNKWKLMRQEI